MRVLLLTLMAAIISCSTVSLFGGDNKEIGQFLIRSIHQQLIGGVSPESIDHCSSKTPICTTCHIAMRGLQKLPHRQMLDMLVVIGTKYCVVKKMEDKPVCKGAINQMVNYIITSLWAHYFDPHLACHKIKLCPKEYETLTVEDYAKHVLAGKPNNTQQQPTNKKILKVLHITDLHPDLFYQEGTPAVCGEPVCCRTDVKAQNGSFPAGFWGSNAECDVPLRTFNLFLDYIKNQSLDFVLWTGDNTAHDIWKQSQSYNLNFTTILSDLLKKKIKVPVIPALGNHESYPVNVYEWGKGNSIQLNDGVAEAWKDWIGPEAAKVVKQKGYFSTVLTQFNLKIIALNTQAGNDQNWVLLINPTDPGNHLEWLYNELLESEKKSQFVYIIGHIPPADNVDLWSQRFNILVDRFNYIIRGQFFGHTHNDHMCFFTAVNDTSHKIINNCMIAPSFTTSTNRNPRYRILKVDRDTMRVIDYDQYKLNLKRNWTKEQIPVFQQDYSLLKEYGLSSFGFADQEKLRDKLENDAATQVKYTFHQFGGITPGTSGKVVGCSTRATRTLKSQCMGSTYKPVLFERAAGPWRKLIE